MGTFVGLGVGVLLGVYVYALKSERDDLKRRVEELEKIIAAKQK